MPGTPITVELYADLACPWCYLGEVRLARALAAFADLERAARGDGLDFDFTGIARANNTADTHRLVLFAEERGAGSRMARAL